MYPVTVKLRDQEITGSCTNDDAFAFALLYYNQAEKELAEKGQEQLAFSTLSDRWRKELESAKDKEKKQEEMGVNLTLKIRNAITNDLNTRKNVCFRILEVFPEMPPELVYFINENRFGIRLQIDEMIAIFSVIMATAFEKFASTTEAETRKAASTPKSALNLSAEEVEIIEEAEDEAAQFQAKEELAAISKQQQELEEQKQALLEKAGGK